MNISPKRLEEIKTIPDSAIDTSDISELDDHFWKNAKIVKPITKNFGFQSPSSTRIKE
ncbi:MULTISPECIES: hypothetical protein [unclassified Moorena]|uniref:hypothetical protein n=1 Tax=unclassified Moorena TaxID=2683338 RepID=UPI00257B810A|nr:MULTISPECIES: hypothetical protein [unclassified Moorena]